MIKSNSSAVVALVLVSIICTLGSILCRSLADESIHDRAVASHSRMGAQDRSPLGWLVSDAATSASTDRQRHFDGIWMRQAASDERSLRKRSADQLDGSDGDLLEKLIYYKNNNNNKYFEKKDKQMNDESHKMALKRKLHKFIDTIIDDELTQTGNEDNQKPQASQSSYAPQVSKVGVPMQRKRLAASSTAQQANIALDDDIKQQSTPLDLRKRLIGLTNEDNNQQQQQLSLNNDNPQALGSNAAEDNMLTNDNNSQSQQQQQSLAKHPKILVNPSEHARRILDDKFGIIKESIFTTNNHLGNKGVPKIGSDEDF